MAKKLPTIWDLEPHTGAKHAILRRYLQAWLPILGRHHGRIVYMDGFAGPGIYSRGEPGSPKIALSAAIEQQQFLKGEVIFLFIEQDEERLASLHQQIATLPLPERFKVRPHLGDCNEVLAKILDDLDAAENGLAPAFVFLDPFGFSDTPMSLVARLMQHQRCEIMITFMFEEINRFLKHEKLPDHFDQLFGSTEWRAALTDATPSLRRERLKNLYQQQLKASARAQHVLAFEMRNDSNSLDYILFFGTNSMEGLKKMKEAMWKVDPVAGFTFSDATDPSQTVMFTPEPDRDDIRRRLLARFAGQTVSVEQIERFILERTPYRETHYKSALKAMEAPGMGQVTVTTAKAGRRRGTFPPGTTIRFDATG